MHLDANILMNLFYYYCFSYMKWQFTFGCGMPRFFEHFGSVLYVTTAVIA